MHSDSPFCHNCGVRLTGPFCAACGQKSVPLSVTFHDFFHEFTHEMLHVDGRLFQSARRLMLSPGFLTREYLQGRRAQWISPIRLYLLFSVAFFALSAITGVRVGVSESGQRSRGFHFSLSGGPQGGIAGRDDADAEDEARKLGFENLAALQDAVDHAILAWIPRVMFVLLPLFAWLVALAYRGIDRNYLHHVIFAVHVHAAWFAAGTIAKIFELASRSFGQPIVQLVPAFAAVYAILAFRRVYGRVRFGFVRIGFVLMAYLALFVLAFAAVVIPVVFRQFLLKPA